jgi:hypothetical protein
MSRWLFAAAFCLCLPSLAAAQQIGGDVRTGVNGNSGSMFGPNIDMVNGTNANGTPRQLLPGASMTNGAGNSTMTPGITGGSITPNAPVAPPTGIAIPTLNGQASTTAQ